MTTDLTAATAADLSALYAAGAASPVEDARRGSDQDFCERVLLGASTSTAGDVASQGALVPPLPPGSHGGGGGAPPAAR